MGARKVLRDRRKSAGNRVNYKAVSEAAPGPDAPTSRLFPGPNHREGVADDRY